MYARDYISQISHTLNIVFLMLKQLHVYVCYLYISLMFYAVLSICVYTLVLYKSLLFTFIASPSYALLIIVYYVGCYVCDPRKRPRWRQC